MLLHKITAYININIYSIWFVIVVIFRNNIIELNTADKVIRIHVNVKVATIFLS